MRLVRARYQISRNGIPHNYCDWKDIALQTARFLKSRNMSTVTMKDLETGEEIVVAFKAGNE
jgi:hypothetical protein